MHQYLSTSSRSLPRTPVLRTTSCRILSSEALACSARRFQSTTTTRKAVVRRVRDGTTPMQRQQHNSNSKRLFREAPRVRFSSQAVDATQASTLSASESAGLGSSYMLTKSAAEQQPAHISWQGARALFVASAVPMVRYSIAFCRRWR